MTTPRIETLSVTQACQALGLSRASLYRLIERRQLRRTKLLGRTLFRLSEIERLLQRSTR